MSPLFARSIENDGVFLLLQWTFRVFELLSRIKLIVLGNQNQ